jgi:hypothetical protein
MLYFAQLKHGGTSKLGWSALGLLEICNRSPDLLLVLSQPLVVGYSLLNLRVPRGIGVAEHHAAAERDPALLTGFSFTAV